MSRSRVAAGGLAIVEHKKVPLCCVKARVSSRLVRVAVGGVAWGVCFDVEFV